MLTSDQVIAFALECYALLTPAGALPVHFSVRHAGTVHSIHSVRRWFPCASPPRAACHVPMPRATQPKEKRDRHVSVPWPALRHHLLNVAAARRRKGRYLFLRQRQVYYVTEELQQVGVLWMGWAGEVCAPSTHAFIQVLGTCALEVFWCGVVPGTTAACSY